MKRPRSSNSKRVKRYKTKISESNIAEDELKVNILSTIDSSDIFTGANSLSDNRDIIIDEENTYPDSLYDFI